MKNMEQKICQSCAVPFEIIKCGTNADGTESQDYCELCFANGDFFYPKATMEDVIESSIPDCVPDPFPDEETARMKMKEFYPTLKRWAK